MSKSDTIDAMTAGYWLDELVAVKIFSTEKPREFSTDIVAAWEVVEALYTDGWHVQITLDPRFNGEKRVQFAKPSHRNGGTVSATADTIPLAICRAAIKVSHRDEYEEAE